MSCLGSLPIPDSALFSFHQPIGTGVRVAEAELRCPAARWACLALAADEVQELVESGSVSAFVEDRVDTFNIRRAGVPVTSATDQDCDPATEEWELLLRSLLSSTLTT